MVCWERREKEREGGTFFEYLNKIERVFEDHTNEKVRERKWMCVYVWERERERERAEHLRLNEGNDISKL